MKRLVVSVFLLITVFAATAQNKKVAVMETKTNEGVTSFQSNLVRGGMETAVSNAPGYEGYDRAAFDVILKEQNFQRSGAVDEAQIKAMGKMAGVQYVLVTEASAEKNDFYIYAKLLDVETGRFVSTANKLCKATPTDIDNSCAELANILFGVKTVVSKPQKKPSVTPVAQTPIKNNQITENKKKYYLNGEVMDKGEYLEFIQSTCPQAYDYYRKGTKQRNIGWILAGAGYGVSVIGTIATQNVTFSIVGIAIGASSIPFFIMGCTKRNTSHEVYNKSCAGKSTASLSFGPTSNGLGVSLNF